MSEPSIHGGVNVSRAPTGVSAESRRLCGAPPVCSSWQVRWALVARLGCNSELIESFIMRQRSLEKALRCSSESSAVAPSETISRAEQRRMQRELDALNETFGCFCDFMEELRGLSLSSATLGTSFSDPLYRYFSSARTVRDFALFNEEVDLQPEYNHLRIKLFCREVGRYVEALRLVAADPLVVLEGNPSIDHIALFVRTLVEPYVYLPPSEWVGVIQVCKALVECGVLDQACFLDLTIKIVERAHSTEYALEVLSDAISSFRGSFSSDLEQALYKLGVTLAQKRNRSALVECPQVSSHPIVEFGYYSELAYRMADFGVKDHERRKNILRYALSHQVVVQVSLQDSVWYTAGIARMQEALVKTMENFEPKFAVELIQRCADVLWKEWENLGTLWRGATHGSIFGDMEAQRTFLRYILQDSHSVAALKGILSEATNPLGATYHLVSGLRGILRARRCAPDATDGAVTIRALALLAHAGQDGMTAAPEVLGLLGICTLRLPIVDTLVSPPFSWAMDSDLEIRRSARSLMGQWEQRYGPFSATIRSKLARYDMLFVSE